MKRLRWLSSMGRIYTNSLSISYQTFKMTFEACLVLRGLSFPIPVLWVDPLKQNSIFLGLTHLHHSLGYFGSHLFAVELSVSKNFRFQSPIYQVCLSEEIARPFEAKLEHTSGRKFCITENGYTGIVPGAVKPGDQLLVIKGIRILYLFYPYEDGFRLIGDAHIHILMDGSACNVPNLKFQEIALL